MIIPMPSFSPVVVEYSGLNFFQRAWKSFQTSPQFVLTKDWTIFLDDGLPLVFPSGFITDFASIPRLFWSIPGFSPSGPLLTGSIPHDFGYQHGYFLTPFVAGKPYPQKSIDARAKYSKEFGDNIPVFIGRPQSFFDQTMEGIVKLSGANFVAGFARKTLGVFGGIAWGKYRKHGPGAFGSNSLGLPGVNCSGEIV